MKKLSIAVVGCGTRAVLYLTEALRDMPLFYEVVAGADPQEAAVETMRALSGNPQFRGFDSADALLAEDRMADVVLISTQDHMHFAPCMAAMRKGYDILLEKPIATTLEEVLLLEAEARRLGRRVMLCHIYRYAPFYEKVKAIVESGVLGEIVSVNASEGVGQWHNAHSFVRGKWAVTARATPMILAKCCHDMDYLSWLIDAPCLNVSSYGTLSYFNERNAPEGAPARCTDGCPVSATCMYNAVRYAGDKRYPWLPAILPDEASATADEIVDWLKVSPWGRCVYRCDNDVVDHQVVAMEFAGGVTCTFTMTAFDNGRSLEIYGTRATLKAGEALHLGEGRDILVTEHATGRQTTYDLKFLPDDYIHHEGGDSGMIRNLYAEMHHPDPTAIRTSITKSTQSHLMAFAAEESRLTGRTVAIPEMVDRVMRDVACTPASGA